MALVARLAALREEALEEARRALEEAKAEWGLQVTRELEAITEQCEAAARKGKGSVTATFGETWWDPSWSEGECERILATLSWDLASEKRNHILSKLVCKLSEEGLCHGQPVVCTSQESGAFYYVVELSWEGVQPSREQKSEQHPPGNLYIECGICRAEQGVAVRLSPCGHLICAGCAQQDVRHCPFCRTPVLEVQQVYRP